MSRIKSFMSIICTHLIHWLFFFSFFFFLFFRMWGVPSIIGFGRILLVYWVVCICCMHKTESNRKKNQTMTDREFGTWAHFLAAFVEKEEGESHWATSVVEDFTGRIRHFLSSPLPNIFAVWLSQTHLAVGFAYRTERVHHFNYLLFMLCQSLPKLLTQAKNCMSDILLFTLTSRGE